MSFFSVDDYVQPEWKAEPQYRYYFEVIKDGSLLGKLDIKSKSFNLIGRLDDLCDVAIDNPTVSRKHAILQAKKDDPYLYLYDLGSSHGSFVNKERLPARTFKKLQPFDNVKFGVSSRIFVLRCPQYEQLQEGEQVQKDNKFSQLLQQQNKQLSKAELKVKYLDMLQNDPMFQASGGPRTLKGQQSAPVDEYQGIDWGITDQREVYAYRSDSDLPIQPDVLRRLALDNTQFAKIAEYEEHMRKYQQVEGELNELTSRQKRQFGLEQKMQERKEKLEKKFVQALEAVEKAEDWLRVNIFGEQVNRDKPITLRQRQNDTFGDDQYLDRTLQNKNQQPIVAEKPTNELTTEDYWRLEKELTDNMRKLEMSKNSLQQIQKNQQSQNIQPTQNEEDEFEAFMQMNDGQLRNENTQILRREIQFYESQISRIRGKFASAVGSQAAGQIKASAGDLVIRSSIKQAFKEGSIEENLMQAKKKMEQQQNIENILNRLQNVQREEQELNELDPSIFNYYTRAVNQLAYGAEQQEQQYDLDQYKLKNKVRYDSQYKSGKFQKPISKKPQPVFKVEEEDAVDLTRNV